MGVKYKVEVEIDMGIFRGGGKGSGITEKDAIETMLRQVLIDGDTIGPNAGITKVTLIED